MTSEKLSSRDRIYFNYTEPVACWNEPITSINNSTEIDNVQFCLAIGLVCKNVVQTGGAGDNVSGNCLFTFLTFLPLIVCIFPAAGLVLQI